ncbi:MAG: hypothetical protein CIT01_01240 [Methanobacterium sp. BRmetb2]|jgi:hypothetical protein|nr:MAG: hypothetical protein CIT01_01240 [Methanobacterium sp. BRmetb2]
MINKEELVEKIENTDLEKLPGTEDIWEKNIYLNNKKVLIVGYKVEEPSEYIEPGKEVVKTYYWYWELRNSQTWEILYENHDQNFNFCESDLDSWGDEDRVEDVVGDIDEEDVCKWSEQDLIKDISEDIADEVMIWLKS